MQNNNSSGRIKNNSVRNMKLISSVEYRFKNLFKSKEDPIESAQNLVNKILRSVGIYDVFGFDEKWFTPLTLMGMVIFAGPFAYFAMLSQTMYLLRSRSTLEIFLGINYFGATCVPLTKYIFMWTARKKVKAVFTMCREGMQALPQDGPAQQVFRKTVKQAEVVSWVVIVSQFSNHFLYLVMPLVMTIVTNSRHLPTTPGELYGFPDKYNSPDYELTFTATILATMFSAIVRIGFIVLYVIILGHEIAHFYAIKHTLTDLCDRLKNETVEDRDIQDSLNFCIKHHQFLYRYNEKVEMLYRGVCMSHSVIMSVVLVATLQTMYFNEHISNSLLSGITAVLPLFIYCFGGELLMSAAEEMSTALYFSGWEHMKPRHAKMVLLMLTASQRPICLTAANFFVLNRYTFGKIVQTVYKVYTVFK